MLKKPQMRVVKGSLIDSFHEQRWLSVWDSGLCLIPSWYSANAKFQTLSLILLLKYHPCKFRPRMTALWPTTDWQASFFDEILLLQMCLFSTLMSLWHIYYHSLNGCSDSFLTATFNSYGNRQISTPYKISTPEPIEKFGTVDYVREGTPYTKFGTNPPTEGFWANGWNITKIIFIYLYLFFRDSRTGQTGWWIFTRNSSLDV